MCLFRSSELRLASADHDEGEEHRVRLPEDAKMNTVQFGGLQFAGNKTRLQQMLRRANRESSAGPATRP